MPGLIGYMLAIVVTLGGYYVGLHWLVSPPDPWLPNAKVSAANAQQFSARKRQPVAKLAETVNPAPAASMEADTRLASVETSPSVETGHNETARSIEPTVVQTTRPAEATLQVDVTRPAAEPVRIARREMAPTRTRPVSRKRVERNPGRKLELMVLRTYERSDGKRFTRLLPMSSVRSAMAFQPDDRW